MSAGIVYVLMQLVGKVMTLNRIFLARNVPSVNNLKAASTATFRFKDLSHTTPRYLKALVQGSCLP